MMKKLNFLLMLLLLGSASVFAQDREIVRIKAGEDPASSYSPHGFYRFPHFQEGFALLKNGEKTGARFNYHMLNQEIQFLSRAGDTLALADPFSIKYISIDSTIFYYSEGYLEVLENHEALKLAARVRLETQWEKIGAYGQASPSGSIRSPNKLILGNTGKELSLNQNILIRKDYTYYWIDKYGTVLKATKANIFKLMPPDAKTHIEDFLKKNKIDFTREADLKKLLHFATSDFL